MGAQFFSWWLCLGLTGGPASTGLSTKAQERLSILYSIEDLAGVPPDVARRAEAELRAVFRQLDLDLIPMRLAALAQVERSSARPCVGGLRVFVVSEQTFHTARPDSISVGFTARSPESQTRAAFVAYGRIVALARTSEMSPAILLGRVMAHEIAHLLLPLTGHADRGLLSAHWMPGELLAAAQGAQHFGDRKQALRRRAAELSARAISSSCSQTARGIQ